ncbi:MAG: symmetrical bis(5'-nucleosyl)-tetraphosphatase [Methylohalobius sp.]|nr:symmetrical bis(5'-nucleosyl)-tetraphosphatase [Methylohalobius sp.]
MAHYAIGDVQGCFFELNRLLDKIKFDPASDFLWFTGDLVNRGPHSLETLRFVKSLGDRAVTVLGNHDLHLLAVANGQEYRHKQDLAAILTAPDRDELIDWLRRRPLLYQSGKFCLIHAGLPPQWDLDTARRCAREVESVLQSERWHPFLHHMYGNEPDIWSEDLTGWARWRFIVNCFTRLRYCDQQGRLVLEPTAQPQEVPHLVPWFRFPRRASQGQEIIFGHWSTLGFVVENGCYGIDTGCVWGGQLTALRLDGEMYRISIDCPCYRRPG